MAGIARRPGTIYSVLTPNLRGINAAAEAKADEFVICGAASEAFSQRNINCSIAESIARFEPVAEAAKTAGIRLRGSISCALDCPYQGQTPIAAVIDVVKRMEALGCDEIDIADTIGTGTPKRVGDLFRAVGNVTDPAGISGHFHDTYGQALANILAALEAGVDIFHTSVAGLGGCPYQGQPPKAAGIEVVKSREALGCEEIDIADTIGTGTPKRVGDLFRAVGNVTDPAGISGHVHDTYGQALANILAALEAGVTIFHTSVAGLGGCPYAKGATGHGDTVDVLYLTPANGRAACRARGCN